MCVGVEGTEGGATTPRELTLSADGNQRRPGQGPTRSLRIWTSQRISFFPVVPLGLARAKREKRSSCSKQSLHVKR